jgi:hypothetical protein
MGTEPLAPITMPSDRVADSYRIYSVLMPVDELGGKGWPHELYLLEDTTVALVKPDEACRQEVQDSGLSAMNPHNALTAPESRAQDLAELLEDFDKHCHERVKLTADGFKLQVPLRLLNEDEQEEFIRTRFGATKDVKAEEKYRGAPGLSSFSQVYFNAHHTVAMVYASGWCGGTCAQAFWVVFEKDSMGQWKTLRWNSTMLMS